MLGLLLLASPAAGTPTTFPNKAELKAAVDAWLNDKEATESEHGAINTWDVSQVTDMYVRRSPPPTPLSARARREVVLLLSGPTHPPRDTH